MLCYIQELSVLATLQMSFSPSSVIVGICWFYKTFVTMIISILAHNETQEFPTDFETRVYAVIIEP